MIILLSPAKSLDMETAPPVSDKTTPVLLEHADYLMSKLQKLSSRQIAKLMSVSKQIADLNFARNQVWNQKDNSRKQALFTFNGEVYRGLDAASFNKTEIKRAQKSVRILSGLYGLLKPLDEIQPYRLEMGSKLKVTAAKNNLYKYWGGMVTQQLNSDIAETGSDLVLNLASNEYFKVLQAGDISAKAISCKFMDEKNGELKVRFAYAKLARGYMTNYIIEQNIKDEEGVMAFDRKGYRYHKSLSADREFVFTR